MADDATRVGNDVVSDGTSHLFGDGRLSYIQIPAAQAHASGAFYARVFGFQVRGGSDAHLSFTDATGDMIGAFVTGRVVSREPGVLPYIYVYGINPAGNVIGIWQHGPRN